MSANFDLKKFLKENKAIENLNPIFKSFNDIKSNETKKSLVENIKTKLNNIPLTEDKLRERIREMILAEFEGQDVDDIDEMEMDEEDIYEAKKDEEVTDEESPVEDGEEFPLDDEFTDEETESTGDEGEADILTHLNSALEVAKTKGDEKLIDQIGNTITFFTRQYIVK